MPADIQRTPLQYVERDFRLQTLPFPCYLVVAPNTAMEKTAYGFKVYATPVELGAETERESTWFHGYHEKFFIDRGVLYHFLYGKLAGLMSVRFLMAHGKVMCQEIPGKKALQLMKAGIRSVRGL